MSSSAVYSKKLEKDEKKNKDCNGWVSGNKNWKLAKKCIEIMCRDFKLKGLLVGRKGCELPPCCKGLIETTSFMSQSKLIESYRKSKFIFIPCFPSLLMMTP